MYKYQLWAWTYIKGGEYKEWYRTVYRKNKMTEKQKESISGHFADKLAWTHNCNIALYGCNEI